MNIKQIIIASTLLVSVASFAQKDELKALKKIYAKDEIKGADLEQYKSLVAKLEPIATEESDKVYATFYKSMTPLLEINALGANATPLQLMKYTSAKSIEEFAAGLNATLDYEKKIGKKVYTDDIKKNITGFKPIIENIAFGLTDVTKIKDETVKSKSLMSAASIFYSLYTLDKTDKEKLFNASTCAVTAGDYDKALEYYQELKAINYSGEGTNYFATDKTTQKEEYFGTSPVQRDLMIKTGQYEKPRSEIVPSKRGEIYKNIAIILLQKGKNEEAKTAIAEARKANPDDVSLIVTEADLYYKLKDVESYKRLVNEALAKSPNDASLVFNLGVVSNSSNQFEDAAKYYRRAIEIDPNFVDAYLNLADNILKPDSKLVEDINKLGSSTSEKDLKKYQALTVERKKIFNEVMPVYEKALELSEKLDQTNPKIKEQTDIIKSNLKTVYSFLELSEKSKALKAKM